MPFAPLCVAPPARLALAAALAAAAAPLGAQAAPAPAPAAEAAPSPAGWPAPGTRVRFLLTDTASVFGNELYVQRPAVPMEARLVRLDSATLDVRIAGRGHYTFPPSSVRWVHARASAGLCGRSGARRAACVLLGAGAGALAGAALSSAAGEPAPLAVFGGAFGTAVGFGIGRDRWVPVPGWARGQ